MANFGAFHDYLTQRTADDLFAGVVRIDVDEPDGTTRTLLEQGYGLASRAWGVPCTPDIRFDTASTTKLFTAVAALQQVDAGAFTLQTPVMEYLGLAGTAIPATVTPYHLLTHTSGIADDADEEAGERYEDLFVDKPNYALRETIDILPNFVHKQPNFAPGEGIRYCNVGYVLLGLMVERATGMVYRDYVRDHVFDRAGMKDATFASSDIVTERVAEGAEAVRDENDAIAAWKRNIFSYPPSGAPDGGAHVTAADLIAFHQALRAGRLMSAELTAQMLRPHVFSAPRKVGGLYQGFGLVFSVDAEGQVLSYWKEGINVGVSATLTHYPPRAAAEGRDEGVREDLAGGVTLVILCTMEDGAWEPIRELNRMLGVAHSAPDTIDEANA